MKKITLAFMLLAFVCMPLSACALSKVEPTEEAIKNLASYPEKVAGMDRFVIYLTPKDNEAHFKVELIAGKTMEVDCNRHTLAGEFKKDDVKGWGYSYYSFFTKGHVASTLMACPDGTSEKFVQAPGLLVPYNSRLPLVVYVQEGYELKYKIWTAGKEQGAEKK